MTSRRNAWIVNLLLCAATSLFTVMAFEVGLRLFLPQKLYRFPRGLFRSDRDRVFLLNPGFRGILENPEYRSHVRINSLGLRGPDIGPKVPGRIRVLVLGDSFVSALNVEEPETFLSVMEGRLRQALAPRSVEVINAGTPGYGTWHELQLLRTLAPRTDPDLVVFCVYVGNDLEDNLHPHDVTVRDGFLESRRRPSGFLPIPVRSWLQRHCMTYVFVWNAWNSIRPMFGIPETDRLAHFKGLVTRTDSALVEEEYRLIQRLLREVAEEARKRLLPVLVVLIPAEEQVYPERFAAELGQERREASVYDMERPNRKLAEILKEEDLPVLDLLPVFRAHLVGPYLYMSLDGHLTREGNRLVGETLAGSVRPLIQAPSRQRA